jgi:hypothetical protein
VRPYPEQTQEPERVRRPPIDWSWALPIDLATPEDRGKGMPSRPCDASRDNVTSELYAGGAEQPPQSVEVQFTASPQTATTVGIEICRLDQEKR